MKKTVVIKRNGDEVSFNQTKIKRAIIQAMTNGSGVVKKSIAGLVASDAESHFAESNKVGIGEIENYVVDRLIHYGQNQTALSYESYKTLAALRREVNVTDDAILTLVGGTNIDVLRENSNKSAEANSTMRDLIAGEVSKDLYLRKLAPTDVAEAHLAGTIHSHDADYLFQKMGNCCLVNLESMLDEYTIVNNVYIDKQSRFQTAVTVMTQIAANIASGQFGGQTMSVAHLAKYARLTKDDIFKEKMEDAYAYTNSPDLITVRERADKSWKKMLKDSIQTMQYQLSSIASANGQSPFITLSLDINEKVEYRDEVAEIISEIFKQRAIGVKNAQGQFEPTEFPKLWYVLNEDNVHEESPYFWLTQEAAACWTKSMSPDFGSQKISKQITGSGFAVPPMGCRSFLSKWINPETGQEQYWGRSNLGVFSLNLPDIALAAGGDIQEFYQVLDVRLNTVKNAMKWKKQYMQGTLAEVSPIHYVGGALARKNAKDTIDDILDKRTAISLGYVGMHETIVALIGESITTEKGHALALEIVKYLKQWCDNTKEEIDLGVGLYGTPSESLAGKFLEKTKARYGVVPGVTDREFFTNSFHVHVAEDINAFDKIALEADFQWHSQGGFISYIETNQMDDKIPMIIQLLQFGYNTSRYFELNHPISKCYKCGSKGKIGINSNYEYECESCGNDDASQILHLVRCCGYLTKATGNKGRMSDYRDRVTHI
ncbi:MAG: anaerobic ribonucleoside-triphosphate reductase [Phocaeicola sp.]